MALERSLAAGGLIAHRLAAGEPGYQGYTVARRSVHSGWSGGVTAVANCTLVKRAPFWLMLMSNAACCRVPTGTDKRFICWDGNSAAVAFTRSARSAREVGDVPGPRGYKRGLRLYRASGFAVRDVVFWTSYLVVEFDPCDQRDPRYYWHSDRQTIVFLPVLSYPRRCKVVADEWRVGVLAVVQGCDQSQVMSDCTGAGRLAFRGAVVQA